MAEYILREFSPRHRIPFNHIPTVRGSIRGGSCVVHSRESYGPILDCVYEMADQVATSNGVSVEEAIKSVAEAERWRVMPRHQKLIATMLKEAS